MTGRRRRSLTSARRRIVLNRRAPGAAQGARRRREEITERIREKSPRLASLTYPRSLTLAGMRAVLDQGTALVSYASPRTDPDLRRQRRHGASRSEDSRRTVCPPFRGRRGRRSPRAGAGLPDLIQQAEKGNADLTALVPAGRQLYDELIRPIEEFLAPAERLLVCPDGPLHALPFGALIQSPASTPRRSTVPRAMKPLHLILSGTVYAEVLKHRGDSVGASSSPQVVALPTRAIRRCRVASRVCSRIRRPRSS